MALFLKKIIVNFLFWTPFIVFAGASLICVVRGLVIFGDQILNWIEDGVWLPCPLLYEVTPQYILFRIENIQWVYAQKIVAWLFVELPSSVSLVILGLIVYGIGYLISSALVVGLEKKWKVTVYILPFLQDSEKTKSI